MAVVDALEQVDEDASALRQGQLLPEVAQVLLSRAGWLKWEVSVMMMVRPVGVCVCAFARAQACCTDSLSMGT